jgi:hypothetical protein
MAKRTSGDNPHDLYDIIVKKNMIFEYTSCIEWWADSSVNRKVLGVLSFLLTNRKWHVEVNFNLFESIGSFKERTSDNTTTGREASSSFCCMVY